MINYLPCFIYAKIEIIPTMATGPKITQNPNKKLTSDATKPVCNANIVYPTPQGNKAKILSILNDLESPNAAISTDFSN